MFFKYFFIYYKILHGVSDQIFILIDKEKKQHHNIVGFLRYHFKNGKYSTIQLI